jgi:hypothetical protein
MTRLSIKKKETQSTDSINISQIMLSSGGTIFMILNLVNPRFLLPQAFIDDDEVGDFTKCEHNKKKKNV